jgi:hypothetical protein
MLSPGVVRDTRQKGEGGDCAGLHTAGVVRLICQKKLKHVCVPVKPDERYLDYRSHVTQ